MSLLVKRFERNTKGRDLIVGDVHGCFNKLQSTLVAIDFNPTKDRLFSVGDLVDRGPQSEDVLKWLAEPWFHAVMGNHEQMAALYLGRDISRHLYAQNGGSWLIGKTPAEAAEFVTAFMQLPLLIELETEGGLVGIVHAACDYPSWGQLKEALADHERGVAAMENAIWGRGRIMSRSIDGHVDGVRAVVVGHTPVERVTSLDNVLHIDTGGWLQGGLSPRPITIIDAATLEPINKPATLAIEEDA